jgi:hypothetical protein
MSKSEVAQRIAKTAEVYLQSMHAAAEPTEAERWAQEIISGLDPQARIAVAYVVQGLEMQAAALRRDMELLMRVVGATGEQTATQNRARMRSKKETDEHRRDRYVALARSALRAYPNDRDSRVAHFDRLCKKHAEKPLGKTRRAEIFRIARGD